MFEKFIPYHVLSRAVDNKPIFADQEDCARFLFQIYANNVGKPGLNLYRKNMKDISESLLKGEEISANLVVFNSAPLVDILSFSLVNDHVHFILSPNVENGIAKYIHKLNLSFAKYFNMKHKREGILFNKPYKITPLKSDDQLDLVIRYVNVKNPLDFYDANWQKKLDNWQKAFDFLDSYKFSSYPDLFGQRNSRILAPEVILNKYLGEKSNRNKIENLDFIEDYLNQKLTNYKALFLE